jgi:histidinol phosphatase-like enzyme
MSQIYAHAQAVADGMSTSTEFKQLSPMMVEIIAAVIIEVVKAVAACYAKPKDGLKVVRSPGPLQRFRLRRAVKRHLDDRETYEYLGDDMTKAILKAGDALTEEQLADLYKECAV